MGGCFLQFRDPLWFQVLISFQDAALPYPLQPWPKSVLAPNRWLPVLVVCVAAVVAAADPCASLLLLSFV